MTKMVRQASLLWMLIALTVLLVCAQMAFFFTYYQVSDIADALANASIATAMLHAIILLPVFGFIALQLLAYALLVMWVWFSSLSCGEWFSLSRRQIYLLGVSNWLCCVGLLFALNAYFYPGSFFAGGIFSHVLLNRVMLVLGLGVVSLTGIVALLNSVKFGRHRVMLGIFAFVAAGLYLPAWLPSGQVVSSASLEKPNIILIGLDSLRPDHIGYFGHQDAHTPTIDRFLASSVVFTNAYTPLARTFPSWVSILTAKYPLRSHARANLVAPDRVVANDMLAKRLQADGYFTIYGTDETRFTDITQAYGFDRLIGPAGGAAEFLLGSLSDFPLSNLLLNVPAGKYLFPYQYANRAADVTYRPEQFLALVKAGLAHRPQGPVFLSLHLCLPHWPFKWARDGFAPDASTASRYQGSIAAVDAQLSSLLSLLQEAGLLDHSIVVLLSDHGVTLGARGDRVIAKERYVGDPKQMKAVTVMKLGSAPEMTTDFKRDYSVSASYGQGTDVLSLKQNHVLMAFNGFGLQWPAKKVGAFVSLFDIAPTVLGYLHLQPLHLADGISLGAYFSSRPAPQSLPRTFFIETGDKLAETEVDQIDVAAVVKGAINAYRVDIGSGRLVLTDSAEKNIVENKQHAIIWRDWLLARYPADVRYQMVPDPADGKKKVLLPKRTDPYFVLVNLKTGQWTVGLSSAFAKSAPVVDLMRQFRAFYGSEVA